MIENYYFDTDCLSAFLWVRGESILAQLYPGQIILPAQVYAEVQRVPHLLARVEEMKDNGDLNIQSIMTGTEEYRDYHNMTISPPKGVQVIGKGEAAAIALAKKYDGILASNNMRDIKTYVDEHGLRHITTGDILVEALERGIITENDGNELWANMLKKRRMLPTATFSDYLKTCVRVDVA